MDVLKEAQTVYGIYGFCDIRNFTDATEILEEEVLLYINRIAEVVHEEVGNSNGGANKNIGDAFLVVWKLIGEKDSNIESILDKEVDIEHRRKVYFEDKTLKLDD